APLSGHGALQLSALAPSPGHPPAALRRLELQGCWLVSEQEAARLAAACGPQTLVVVNGKAAAAVATSGGGQRRGEGGRRGKGNAGGAGSTEAGEDLEMYDQRLRYDTEMLMALASSPLAGGRDQGGRSDGVGGGGDGNGGRRESKLGDMGDGSGQGAANGLWLSLPAELRRSEV
ncbi:hypothetical protein Agub_g4010, partial [Astrephomene gubernaculifera]